MSQIKFSVGISVIKNGLRMIPQPKNPKPKPCKIL